MNLSFFEGGDTEFQYLLLGGLEINLRN